MTKCCAPMNEFENTLFIEIRFVLCLIHVPVTTPILASFPSQTMHGCWACSFPPFLCLQQLIDLLSWNPFTMHKVHLPLLTENKGWRLGILALPQDAETEHLMVSVMFQTCDHFCLGQAYQYLIRTCSTYKQNKQLSRALSTSGDPKQMQAHVVNSQKQKQVSIVSSVQFNLVLLHNEIFKRNNEKLFDKTHQLCCS